MRSFVDSGKDKRVKIYRTRRSDAPVDYIHAIRQFKADLEQLILRPMWQAAAERWHGRGAESGIDAKQWRAIHARIRRRRGGTAEQEAGAPKAMAAATAWPFGRRPRA